jgi:two-component system, OmpR family, sensor kinase
MGCVTFMVLMPGQETIPYHLGWAGFALAFGLGTWSRRQLIAALAWYTTATGVALEHSWWVGHISWDETTEIPLMFVLALLMVWNVLRRQAALTEVRRLAARDVQASQDRERLTQLTSHELRTPLTIARGYVELMQARAVEHEDQQDLLVVTDELDRLSRVSDRLIRMIRLQDDTTSELVDIDRVLAQCVERWRVVADRSWVLEAEAGSTLGSPERLRTCIDTLVENAIRYTSVGDTIRLTGSRLRGHVVVGVLDSGVGLSDQQILTINSEDQRPDLSPDQSAPPGSATDHGPGGAEREPMDRLAGTGLGLSIVREIAHARGGVLHASRSPEGGAALVLTLTLCP